MPNLLRTDSAIYFTTLVDRNITDSAKCNDTLTEKIEHNLLRFITIQIESFKSERGSYSYISERFCCQHPLFFFCRVCSRFQHLDLVGTSHVTFYLRISTMELFS